MITAQKQVHRSMKQYIARLEVNPHPHGQLIYDEAGVHSTVKDRLADGHLHHIKNKLKMV